MTVLAFGVMEALAPGVASRHGNNGAATPTWIVYG